MTLEEIRTQLRKLADSAEVDEIYVELSHPEVPSDEHVLSYGDECRAIGFERGKQYAYKCAARLIENCIREQKQ